MQQTSTHRKNQTDWPADTFPGPLCVHRSAAVCDISVTSSRLQMFAIQDIEVSLYFIAVNIRPNKLQKHIVQPSNVSSFRSTDAFDNVEIIDRPTPQWEA